MESLTRIGITHGDINGVGCEVILKTLSDSHIFDCCIPIVYGYSKVLAFYKKHMNLEEVALNIIKNPQEAMPRRVNVINCDENEPKVEFGASTLEAGLSAFAALEKATDDLRLNHIQALVTAPINKHNIHSEKFNFQGHTEYLEKKFDATSSLMFFISESMRIALATNHVPLCEVSKKITVDLLLKKLRLLNESLREDFLIIKPRIAVLALNPHSGDAGLIGDEEQQILIPALKQAEQEGIICVGPFPADGFFGSGTFSSYDAVLAMYHDQALAPFKAMCMDEGVNFTSGLSIVRTSPTHGTAYNIAGHNCAHENSFKQALYLALDIYKNRFKFSEMNKNPLKLQLKERKESNKTNLNQD